MTHEHITFMVGLRLYKTGCEFKKWINKMGQIQVWMYLRNMFKYGHRKPERQIPPLTCSKLKEEFVHYCINKNLCKLNEN